MSDAIVVLLVEDDRHIGLALRIRLSTAGYNVLLAATVAEARILIDEHEPQIALIDINLPDGDGIELMQWFRSRGPTMPVHVIIMTASHSQGLREKALGHGASRFLEKPFSTDALFEAIQSCVDSVRAC